MKGGKLIVRPLYLTAFTANKGDLLDFPVSKKVGTRSS